MAVGLVVWYGAEDGKGDEAWRHQDQPLLAQRFLLLSRSHKLHLLEMEFWQHSVSKQKIKSTNTRITNLSLTQLKNVQLSGKITFTKQKNKHSTGHCSSTTENSQDFNNWENIQVNSQLLHCTKAIQKQFLIPIIPPHNVLTSCCAQEEKIEP